MFKSSMNPIYMFVPVVASIYEETTCIFPHFIISLIYFTTTANFYTHSLHDALPISDCTSPIRGTSFFADRYSFSGMAGEGVVVSTVEVLSRFHVLFHATHEELDAVAPGGVVASIPATTGKFMLPDTGNYLIEVT